MIDTTEKLIPLVNVPALPWLPARRGGAKLHHQTVKNWAKIGCRGVLLESVKVGGVPCTTEAALLRFFERLAAPIPRQTATTPSQERKAQERACAILDAAGI